MSDLSQNQNTSWQRLIALLDILGETQLDLANATTHDITEIEKWQTDGVPQEAIETICSYYSVPQLIFNQPLEPDTDFHIFVQKILYADNSDSIEARLTGCRNNQTTHLDLSGLSLDKIPEQVFEFHWLTSLDLSNNKLDFLQTELLLLQKLGSLNLSHNNFSAFPTWIAYHPSISKLTSNFLNSSESICILTQLKQHVKNEKQSIILIQSASTISFDLLNNIIQQLASNNLRVIEYGDNQLNKTLELASHLIMIYQDDDELIDVVKQLNIHAKLPIIFIKQAKFNLRDKGIHPLEDELFESIGLKQLNCQFAYNVDEIKKIYVWQQAKIRRQHQIKPIKIKSLELNNIGVFEAITIDFDKQISVLIGVNGAGKSTILKAISLAILGEELADLTPSELGKLLRIIDVKHGKTQWQKKGSIRLTVDVNGKAETNEITLGYNINKERVYAEGRRFEALFYKNKKFTNVMKIPIIGISERRSNEKATLNWQKPRHPYAKPLDVMSLINNEQQSCIGNFDRWLGDLAIEQLKYSSQANTLINICFKVFSVLMDEQIQFKTISGSDPVTVWIEHKKIKQITPLELASQGYRAVMGWIGNILQRMFEAYENAMQPLNCPAIIIIDEIDQLLHIKWQQRILQVLAKEFFPNTQWIVTTHSPIILTDLDEHQVISLHQKNEQLIVESNPVGLWMWPYQDIMTQLFDLPLQPIEDIEALKETIAQHEAINDQNTVSKLKQKLERVIESRAYTDTLFKEQQQLQKLQQQMTELIEQIKAKKEH